MSAMYLVTGGAGFIGGNLVRKLVEMGEGVRVLDNFATGRRKNLEGLEGSVELVEGDLRDEGAVAKAVNGVRYVIHFGALPSVARSVEDPMTTNEVNIRGTLNLYLASRDAGVERVVFSSSSSVYGDTPTLPKEESMLPQPLSPYALSKLAGEHYGRMFTNLYGLKVFSLRYFNVFGPRQDPASDYAAVIPLFIRALIEDRAPCLHGDGLQTRDFTYVDDIVAANLACCTAPASAAGGVYNVAWGNRISVKELAVTIARLLGKAIEPVHGAARAGDVRDSQADATRAKEQLGWTPQVPFEEGLRRTIDWFSTNPKG
ncbi:MAG TPA: SDR family oxidoreductase [Kiritimatiellia bacterium]|nr:SDR family oxidoreductase [Kiritimatiellia bacterium]